MVLIDTSIIIDYLRQKDKRKTILFDLMNKKHVLHMSIISHAESYAGKSIWEKREAKETLEALFSDINIIALSENISESAGEISAKYNVDIVDAIIAATAISKNYPLATLNIKDFEKINGIKILEA